MFVEVQTNTKISKVKVEYCWQKLGLYCNKTLKKRWIFLPLFWCFSHGLFSEAN